jgi:hypothetical protein
MSTKQRPKTMRSTGQRAAQQMHSPHDQSLMRVPQRDFLEKYQSVYS